MATYNIDNLPAKFQAGDVIVCPYSGTEKSINLPRGEFTLECWGGHGHWESNTSTYIAYGGYSTGKFNTTGETLYLNCGGNGLNNSSTPAYNGGGLCVNARGHNGGGATHIATRSGVLSSLSSYKSNVILVAGGSGGCASVRRDAHGGLGGGTNGGDGVTSSNEKFWGLGGTQTGGGRGSTPYGEATDGTFGQGGNGYRSSGNGYPGAGGGGWYGGGGGAAASGGLATDNNGAGGGGSGYTSQTLSNAHTYRADESGFVSNPDTTNYAGYIKITVNRIVNEFDVFYNGSNKGMALEGETVNYKGSTLLTLATESKTLLTQGKYCEGGITIGGIILATQKKRLLYDVLLHCRKPVTNLLPRITSFSLSNITVSDDEGTYQTGVTAMANYNLPTPIVGHKYYGRVEQLVPPNTQFADGRFEYFVADAGGTGNVAFTSFSQAIQDNQWHTYSSIQQFTGLYAQSGYYVRSFSVNATNASKRRNHMIIDLTESFGAGNEPTKEWCDANIPYFIGTIDI